MKKQITVKTWIKREMFIYADQVSFDSLTAAAKYLREKASFPGFIGSEVPGYGKRVNAMAGL